jgi:hypothetical protein
MPVIPGMGNARHVLSISGTLAQLCGGRRLLWASGVLSHLCPVAA